MVRKIRVGKFIFSNHAGYLVHLFSAFRNILHILQNRLIDKVLLIHQINKQNADGSTDLRAAIETTFLEKMSKI